VLILFQIGSDCTTQIYQGRYTHKKHWQMLVLSLDLFRPGGFAWEHLQIYIP
jgi:hypothetical protein